MEEYEEITWKDSSRKFQQVFGSNHQLLAMLDPEKWQQAFREGNKVEKSLVLYHRSIYFLIFPEINNSSQPILSQKDVLIHKCKYKLRATSYSIISERIDSYKRKGNQLYTHIYLSLNI